RARVAGVIPSSRPCLHAVELTANESSSEVLARARVAWYAERGRCCWDGSSREPPAGNEDRLNGLPTPPLAPQAWCRRVLTSLNQRQVAEREAGYLEMLLTYFIERDPTAEAFTGMLAGY